MEPLLCYLRHRSAIKLMRGTHFSHRVEAQFFCADKLANATKQASIIWTWKALTGANM